MPCILCVWKKRKRSLNNNKNRGECSLSLTWKDCSFRETKDKIKGIANQRRNEVKRKRHELEKEIFSVTPSHTVLWCRIEEMCVLSTVLRRLCVCWFRPYILEGSGRTFLIQDFLEKTSSRETFLCVWRWSSEMSFHHAFHSICLRECTQDCLRNATSLLTDFKVPSLRMPSSCLERHKKGANYFSWNTDECSSAASSIIQSGNPFSCLRRIKRLPFILRQRLRNSQSLRFTFIFSTFTFKSQESDHPSLFRMLLFFFLIWRLKNFREKELRGEKKKLLKTTTTFQCVFELCSLLHTKKRHCLWLQFASRRTVTELRKD